MKRKGALEGGEATIGTGREFGMTDPGAADKDGGTVGGVDGNAFASARRELGVLLVHGMGEQKPGAHVEKVVRSLIASWGTDYEVRDVCQEPERPRPADPAAGQKGDRDGTEARAAEGGRRIVVRVQVGGNQNETVDLHFHEVWWADLGVRTGLRYWGRFLWWVVRAPFLRFRARTGRFDNRLWRNRARNGGLVELESPRSGMRRLPQFFVLGCFSSLAILVAFTWGLLRRLLRGFAPSPVVLLESFGDVQIYTEGARADTGSGPDMGLPSRVPISRRMVQKMVSMAERDYDQWYVMAHSLGSVVAFNGLMEPDYVLPNYLEEGHWDQLDPRFKTQREDDDTENMWPRRPDWLEPTDALSREELFRDLGGFVTYGSPLHVFVDLWPHMVMLNKNDVFAKGFRWLNVCSPFDPISGALRAIRGNEAAAKAKLRPEVFRFSGNRWAFIAHGAYLKARSARRDVGHYLGKWWLRREDFTTPKGVQWPAWLGASLQILLASTGLVALFLGEALAVVTSVRGLLDALLFGVAELCCIVTLTGL